MSESAFDKFVQSISDNALIKNLAVCGEVRIPRALRSVSFVDPGSERYIQRENGARCGVALRTLGLRYASLSALLHRVQDVSNGRT